MHHTSFRLSYNVIMDCNGKSWLIMFVFRIVLLDFFYLDICLADVEYFENVVENCVAEIC